MKKFDDRFALIAGTNIPIPEIEAELHQPKLREIAMIGEENFFTGIAFFAIDKKRYIQDEALLDSTTNFQIFMTVLHDPDKRDDYYCVMSLLTLFFPDYNVSMTPQSIVLDDGSNMKLIDNSNFEALQQVIIKIAVINGAKGEEFKPVNEAAKKIAEKLQKGREKIAQEKPSSSGSVLSKYVSILSVGLHIHLLDVLELTLKQMYDLIDRFTLFTSWDLHNRSCLAGAKPEAAHEGWMGDLYNS